MALFTYGGTPADVLTDEAGNVVTDYPLNVRRAGTGELVTALYEADGTTPISQLRSNPASDSQPGAIRPFRVPDVVAIEYEYLDAGGSPVRWYQPGREVSTEALSVAQAAAADVSSKLDRTTTEPQNVAGPVTFEEPIAAPNLADLPGARWFIVSGTIDGSAADRTKVQAQLDAARDAGGGIVVVPPGRTYGIDTFLVIYDNTVLWAYGATFKAIGNSGILRNFRSDEVFSGYTGHSHITLLGGTYDGNAADGTTGTVTSETDVINFVHAADITVRDVTVLNTSTAHALEFNSVDGGRAINCSFYGFRDNSAGGTRGFSEAVQVDMSRSGSSSIGAFDNTPAKNIRVEGCRFGSSSRLGKFGRAVGSHTLTAGVVYDSIKVLDCEIDGTLQDGIYAYGWSRSLIRGNTIRGTGYSSIRYAIPDPATTAVSPFGVTIRDNHCEGAATDSGIRVVGAAAYRIPQVSIFGNTVKGITGNAVHAEYCAAPNIGRNTADTTSSTGLYAHYSDGANITANTVKSAASNAINVAGSVGCVVASNTVDTTGSNFGVFVGQGADGSTNSTDALVVGNHITAPASAGIRLSTNAARCTAASNKIRKGSGATANGISLAASATDCALLGNDLGGNGWNAATALSVSTAAPVTGPGAMTALPGSNIVDLDVTPLPSLESAMRPAGRYETTSRLRCGTDSQPTSGWLYLTPIWLPKGKTITTIGFISGNTAAAGITNHWFTVHDANRVALARTADAGSAAWAGSTTKELAIAQSTAGAASSYTTTYAGLHYLGVMVAATTPPSLVAEGRLLAGATASPGLGATNSGQTTPPTVTAGAFTAAAFSGSAPLPYGYVVTSN
ncbi:right-handed parallel beta-helix repeat-containing protein [Streptomyces chartreusis]|uniref:right-handed parallel beta-helix repeat-containing protein n=1 Tax=Streptomyces chartreusis TaxID=1969 RepID=UPI00341C92DC